MLKCPESSQVLPIHKITDLENNQIALVTNTGYLLIIPAKALPKLPRGKGNKIIQIPSKHLAHREEYVVDIVILATQKSTLHLRSGKRQIALKPTDLKTYQGKRGQRGHKLPRGLQRIDQLYVDTD